ncbi:hypothetical protein IMZ48_38575 [Candidatus Bathyarchaeota archaeon]|nr:hypothetical protein [Candidatus Bathyarchaeota archaeon]
MQLRGGHGPPSGATTTLDDGGGVSNRGAPGGWHGGLSLGFRLEVCLFPNDFYQTTVMAQPRRTRNGASTNARQGRG